MNILVTEDDPVNLMLLKGILVPLGHSITTAASGTEALKKISETIFDILLLDVMMADIDGFDLTRECRRDPRHRDIPILLITALSSKKDLIKGFECGATDYISKPFHTSELLHRVKAHLQTRALQLRMESMMNELNLQILQNEEQQKALLVKEKELLETNQLLAQANKELLELASRDSLTGLFNRRKGWDYMNYEEERSRRTLKPVGVALFDLDQFKSINDSFGHEVGDDVLKTAAARMTDSLRAADILIRWGGEEFLLILPETDETALSMVAEKIRKAIEDHPWDLGEGRKVTVSGGTVVKSPEDVWETVIDFADHALYQAKESGRNKIVPFKRQVSYGFRYARIADHKPIA